MSAFLLAVEICTNKESTLYSEIIDVVIFHKEKHK